MTSAATDGFPFSFTNLTVKVFAKMPIGGVKKFHFLQ